MSGDVVEHGQTDEDILELISDNMNLESWVEGKTLTVMFDADGERCFAKLRITRVTKQPSAADLRGTPE